MFCQATFAPWRSTIMTHLPHLSKTQATGLALWSLGMVLARSCALTAVSTFVAEGLQQKDNTVRQRLREWCYEATAKRGTQTPGGVRRDLFCPVAGVGAQVVDGHPTGHRPRCHDVGRSLCGVGHQRGLSGLCHSGGVGGAGSREKAGVAPGVVADAAAVAPRRAPRLDGDRAWRIGACMRAGCSGVLCAWGGIRSYGSTTAARFGLRGRLCIVP